MFGKERCCRIYHEETCVNIKQCPKHADKTKPFSKITNNVNLIKISPLLSVHAFFLKSKIWTLN